MTKTKATNDENSCQLSLWRPDDGQPDEDQDEQQQQQPVNHRKTSLLPTPTPPPPPPSLTLHQTHHAPHANQIQKAGAEGIECLGILLYLPSRGL